VLLTISDIKEIFTRLINDEITRDTADRWVYERMQAFDANLLEFNPVSDEKLSWSAIEYLYGINTRISPNEYLHSMEEIKEAFEEKWNTEEG
jgi:hypothetical protein